MELVIKKSKFIGEYYFVDSVNMANDILSQVREKYADATHVCYAYVISSPSVARMSDDKEPSGTAGKPILNAINYKKLSNILVVVIRYFGGVKLGSGGLMRAYSAIANATLDGVQNRPKMISLHAICDIKNVDKVKGLLDKLKVEYAINFTNNAEFDINVNGDIVDVVKEKLDVLCNVGEDGQDNKT